MGLVSLVDGLHRRYVLFTAGLKSKSFSIDSETTVHCYLSPSLLKRSSSEEQEKPVLVLIHGFGPSSHYQWQSQLKPLSAYFDLVVPDLLFFGSSSTSNPNRSESFQARCISKLLDSILSASGKKNKKYSVVGTSYGGFVAYHMGKELGVEKVDKVVLASSDLLKAEEDDRKLAERAGVGHVSQLMLPRGTRELRALAKLAMNKPANTKSVPDFVLRDALRSLFMKNRDEKLELMKAVTIGRKDEFQLTPLPQETLIIWGEHDQIFLVEKASKINKCLGENVRLEIMTNTGHMPQVEDPTKFNEILLNFLLPSPIV